MDKIIKFEKFYDKCIDFVWMLETNATEWKGETYDKIEFCNHDNLRIIANEIEIEDMINLSNTEEIKNIGININVLNSILSNDKLYKTFDDIKFNTIESWNRFCNYHPWSDMPAVIIKHEIDINIKRLHFTIIFPITNRNNGLEDWVYISSYWTYWFEPKSIQSFTDNEDYIEMMEYIGELLQ